MTHEADRDIRTMLALLQVEGLGGATDGSTPERRYPFADTRAYWAGAAQLRADLAGVRAELEVVKAERDKWRTDAYNAKMMGDRARLELSQLKADIAREKARKEAQEGAVAEAAAAVKEKADAQRHEEAVIEQANRQRIDKEKADRKAREEAKEAERQERLRQHPETEEERKARERSELMQYYRDGGYDAMRTGGR